jgi:hypothetical protein
MKQIGISYLKEADHLSSNLRLLLDQQGRYLLDHAPWFSYPYKPRVEFSMAYSDKHIFLKYFVTEKFIRVATSHINGRVWEDSCVEFFISFDTEGYYNLEFNCIGMALVGFGRDKCNRELISAEVISEIEFESIIHNTSSDLIHWELTLAIPFGVFARHSITSLKGKQCRANFYKCGDLLPEPHFVTWSDISSDEPDFHLPQFFGILNFV